MMLPCVHIPSHITALYVFAVVNLMALFHITLVEANVVVLNKLNMSVVELTDLPAKFGPPFPDNGLWGHVSVANPRNACGEVEVPPGGNRSDIKWIAIIRRHGCDFDEKVFNAQLAGYAGALVHNVGSDDLILMGPGKKGEAVDIPSAFIGETDGKYLSDNFDGKLQYFIVIDNQAPFNANNHNLYLLPFAIVVGICFLLMLAFMVAMWIRDIQKRRRARLSLQHLKKLPTKKFKKGDTYDMCAICLDEYEEGKKLPILPCSHAINPLHI